MSTIFYCYFTRIFTNLLAIPTSIDVFALLSSSTDSSVRLTYEINYF